MRPIPVSLHIFWIEINGMPECLESFIAATCKHQTLTQHIPQVCSCMTQCKGSFKCLNGLTMLIQLLIDITQLDIGCCTRSRVVWRRKFDSLLQASLGGRVLSSIE